MDPEIRETCSANLPEDFDKVLACGGLDCAKHPTCQDCNSAQPMAPFSRSCNEDDWSDLLSVGRLPAD